jgi:hypothetical protein
VVFVLSIFVVVVEPLALHQRVFCAGCWFLGLGWCLVVGLEVVEVVGCLVVFGWGLVLSGGAE